jgi:hypothetical protein
MWASAVPSVQKDVAEVSSTAITPVTEDMEVSEKTAPATVTSFLDSPGPVGGLSRHALGSYGVPSRRSRGDASASSDVQNKHNSIVNDRISTVGTFAEKELTEGYGKGSTPFFVGLEPTIIDGQQFDNLYATAPELGPMHADDSMTRANVDESVRESVIAVSRANALRAVERSQFAAFISATTRG